MKRIFLTLVSILSCVLLWAQPKIEFESTTYQFGDIPEAEGKVSGKFTFKNTGTEDLILIRVQPGCGCTAADYTRDSIKPGEQGSITAVYDPYNRPGGFTKSIKVISNANSDSAPIYLYIKGRVIPREKTPFEKLGYTVGAGNLRIKNNIIKVEVSSLQTTSDTILLHNFDTKPLKVRMDTDNVAFTEIFRSFGQEIQPNSDGIIVIKYNPSKKLKWGNFTETVFLYTNDSLEADKRINYYLTVYEDFSKMTPKELSKVPVISIKDTVYDFGQIRYNEEVNREFQIKNTGKTNLIIRQIKPSAPVFYDLDKWTIKPGETAYLNIRMEGARQLGNRKITIDIISNAPAKPNSMIMLTGEIVR